MNQASIQGSWTHSFEEDQGDVQVYRPTHSFAFPPARGRDTLEFGEGGELIKQVPGPDDRPRSLRGNWTALGMNRFRLEGTMDAPGQVIEVVEQTTSVLKIRKI
ncbi:hypothetical protein [Nitrosomonas sp. Nm166]|uniref:hypothetical protein n=1 Tax=Nitrosomonas sp. Nm166 TaxID=1881054 RepID=UPI0008E1A75B|nr:hypothetical protein [Nitrosomonas sp. Nm166]SFE04327.1 hypothetical protein SAMN05428977_100563 [Nitrosomonas sp. Nm166]